MSSTFTVFFEDPYWVGVLEITEPDGTRAARHVFGGEPSGPELLEFARGEFKQLLAQAHAAPMIPESERARPRVVNPKRLARAAAKQQAARPVSTAAQRALSESYSQSKVENRAARNRREAQAARERRDIARAKAKARHRGR